MSNTNLPFKSAKNRISIRILILICSHVFECIFLIFFNPIRLYGTFGEVCRARSGLIGSEILHFCVSMVFRWICNNIFILQSVQPNLNYFSQQIATVWPSGNFSSAIVQIMKSLDWKFLSVIWQIVDIFQSAHETEYTHNNYQFNFNTNCRNINLVLSGMTAAINK